MKFYLLPLLLFCLYNGHAQAKNDNKTRQIEQLQQLKEIVTRKIDTIHLQLIKQADSIESISKKLDQIKKENSQEKSYPASKGQVSKPSPDLLTITVNNLQKKYEQHMLALNKAVNLQKDLEDKISTLVRQSNQ